MTQGREVRDAFYLFSPSFLGFLAAKQYTAEQGYMKIQKARLQLLVPLICQAHTYKYVRQKQPLVDCLCASVCL